MNDWAKVSMLLATGLAGVVTGALAFVSFADTRTLLQLCDAPAAPKTSSAEGSEAADRKSEEAKDTALVKTVFSSWWPNGRDLMVPLLSLTTIAHVSAYVLTEEKEWAIGGSAIALIGPYTGIVLGEDIGALRKADSKGTRAITQRFCALHHVRLVAALSGFTVALCTLAKKRE